MAKAQHGLVMFLTREWVEFHQFCAPEALVKHPRCFIHQAHGQLVSKAIDQLIHGYTAADGTPMPGIVSRMQELATQLNSADVMLGQAKLVRYYAETAARLASYGVRFSLNPTEKYDIQSTDPQVHAQWFSDQLLIDPNRSTTGADNLKSMMGAICGRLRNNENGYDRIFLVAELVALKQAENACKVLDTMTSLDDEQAVDFVAEQFQRAIQLILPVGGGLAQFLIDARMRMAKYGVFKDTSYRFPEPQEVDKISTWPPRDIFNDLRSRIATLLDRASRVSAVSGEDTTPWLPSSEYPGLIYKEVDISAAGLRDTPIVFLSGEAFWGFSGLSYVHNTAKQAFRVYMHVKSNAGRLFWFAVDPEVVWHAREEKLNSRSQSSVIDATYCDCDLRTQHILSSFATTQSKPQVDIEGASALQEVHRDRFQTDVFYGHNQVDAPVPSVLFDDESLVIRWLNFPLSETIGRSVKLQFLPQVHPQPTEEFVLTFTIPNPAPPTETPLYFMSIRTSGKHLAGHQIIYGQRPHGFESWILRVDGSPYESYSIRDSFPATWCALPVCAKDTEFPIVLV